MFVRLRKKVKPRTEYTLDDKMHYIRLKIRIWKQAGLALNLQSRFFFEKLPEVSDFITRLNCPSLI